MILSDTIRRYGASYRTTYHNTKTIIHSTHIFVLYLLKSDCWPNSLKHILPRHTQTTMRHQVKPMNQSMRLMIISVLIASANAFTSISSSTTTTRCHSTLFYRDDDYQIDHPIKRSDFKQRMKNIVKKQKRTAWRPDNMRTADTLQEYANAIEEARRMDRIVVVNFHATWCKVRCGILPS